MSLAKITLIGMYDYDPTLFDGLTVPESLDKEVLVGNILLRSGDFETLYGSIPFMKQAIGIWSSKMQPTFTRWVEAMETEYSPLENYDRHEEWDDDNTGDQTNVRTGDQTNVKSGNETFGKSGSEAIEQLGSEKNVKTGDETHVGSGNETNAFSGSESDTAGGGNTTTNEVSAFDSSTLVTHDKATFNTTQSNTHAFTDRIDTHTLNNLQDKLTYGNVTDERTFTGRKEQTSFTDRLDTTTFNNVQDKLTFNSVQDKRTDNLNLHHKGRVHGNIGVTTSQQMLESEMVLRLKWNLYDQITDLFLTEFVLPIY